MVGILSLIVAVASFYLVWFAEHSVLEANVKELLILSVVPQMFALYGTQYMIFHKKYQNVSSFDVLICSLFPCLLVAVFFYIELAILCLIATNFQSLSFYYRSENRLVVGLLVEVIIRLSLLISIYFQTVEYLFDYVYLFLFCSLLFLGSQIPAKPLALNWRLQLGYVASNITKTNEWLLLPFLVDSRLLAIVYKGQSLFRPCEIIYASFIRQWELKIIGSKVSRSKVKNWSALIYFLFTIMLCLVVSFQTFFELTFVDKSSFVVLLFGFGMLKFIEIWIGFPGVIFKKIAPYDSRLGVFVAGLAAMCVVWITYVLSGFFVQDDLQALGVVLLLLGPIIVQKILMWLFVRRALA